MALVLCPECRDTVSEHAKSCPHCGIPLWKNTMGMTVTNSRSIIQMEYETDLSTKIMDSFLTISPIQQTTLDKMFGQAENLAKVAPSIYQAIKAMHPEKHWVADINAEVQKLLDDGVIKLMMGKDGSVMADLVYTSGAKKGNVFKKLRLNNTSFTPDLASALNDVSMQLQMAQIMQGLENIQSQVNRVLNGQQDDRLSLFDSCMQQFEQAENIIDANLRTAKYLDILSTATNAKCALMRSVQRDLTFFFEREDYSIIQSLLDFKADKHAAEHMNNLRVAISVITQSTAVEAQAYTILGERDAAMVSLRQFGAFIESNLLNSPEKIQYLNSWDQNNDNRLISYLGEVSKSIMELPSKAMPKIIPLN